MAGEHTYLKTHTISGKQLQFRLTEEQKTLLQRAKAANTGRTAKTLVKDGPLRITLVAMRKGGRMTKHHVDGQTSIHVLRGKLTIDTERATADLSSGDVLVFNDPVEHDATARTDCAFLITMAWRGDR